MHLLCSAEKPRTVRKYTSSLIAACSCLHHFTPSALQVLPPFERLHEQATQAPLQWAPVLAMLICNHCHHIPYTAYTGWLQALHTCTFEDAVEPAATLWLLRYLHELALAWPAALTAAEEAPDATAADISTSQLERHWKVQRTFPLPPFPLPKQCVYAFGRPQLYWHNKVNAVQGSNCQADRHTIRCHRKFNTASVCLIVTALYHAVTDAEGTVQL